MSVTSPTRSFLGAGVLLDGVLVPEVLGLSSLPHAGDKRCEQHGDSDEMKWSAHGRNSFSFWNDLSATLVAGPVV